MDDRLTVFLGELSATLAEGNLRAAARTAPELTYVQLGVVDQMRRVPGLTVSTIAEHAGVAVSTASRWVDRLEALGLATREPAQDNRREVVVDLTPTGRELAARWDAARVDIWTRVLGGLDAQDRASLAAAVGTPAVAGAPTADTTAAHDPSPQESSDAAEDSEAFVLRLAQALAQAAPDEVATVVAELSATSLDSDVTLRLATHDGRHLRTAARATPRRPRPTSGTVATPGPLVVDDSVVGDAYRLDTPLVERDGPSEVLHVPVSTLAHRVGVLSIAPARAAGVDDRLRAQGAAAAALAAPHLATPKAASRRYELAARSRTWTVGAEIQTRQLGPDRAAAHGVRIAAHIEPAFNSCTDSFDIELVDAADGPAFDVVVLDSDVDRYSAPLVTGLALGAVRHARAQGLALAEQAALLDEAVFGHFRGEATVSFLLMRIGCVRLTCDVIVSDGIDVVRHNASVQRLPLPRHDPAGITGEGRFATTGIGVGAGDRIAVLGDGFAHHTSSGEHAEAVLRRSRTLSVDEVVRLVGLDLLDRTGLDGPPDDATVVCIDL